jgi:8-oxo-dGTP pyrophosphatase MutT (NUDIX family)
VHRSERIGSARDTQSIIAVAAPFRRRQRVGFRHVDRPVLVVDPVVREHRSMSRAHIERIYAEVEAIDPVDPREEGSKRRVLEGLAMPRPFSEHADPTHVTASAIVVGPEGVLLHFHKKLHLWLQPGGHIEDDEPPWDAAQREVLEETGLRSFPLAGDERVFHVDVHPAGAHVHLDLRYLLTASGSPVPPATESQLVQWFSWDDAFAIADAGLIGALRVARMRR